MKRNFQKYDFRFSYTKDYQTGTLDILDEVELARFANTLKIDKNSEQNNNTSCSSFDLEILNFQNLTCPFGLKHSKYSPGSLTMKAISEDTAKPGYDLRTKYQY
ncbi:hypothetical protein NLM59_04405 [Weeksellaceae bacterium KMM 9724]|uniref:hypothetical protein n=1 Tax=Profundicola chukchiensis TaxID=2961959 RepID=UPI00243F263B|nr:hypothetical protein [Profundicola chukchiensis]MDG4950155.1 hypothetical protein [Profundicola chukchiensis]